MRGLERSCVVVWVVKLVGWLGCYGELLASVFGKMEDMMESFMNKFALTEEERKPVIIRSSGKLQVRSSKSFLVGKLLTQKHFNREVLKHTLRRLWRPKAEVSISDGVDGRFIFAFNSPEERARVVNGGPWLFDHCLLALAAADLVSNPARLPLIRQEFWVQVKGLPLVYMTRETAKLIGDALGTFVVGDQS